MDLISKLKGGSIMAITAEVLKRDRISEGCRTQRFFRNKVYYGIDEQPLKRKVYRGKRDIDGKRKNEIFYVNEKQDIRIEEELLVDSVSQVLAKLIETDDIDIKGWNDSAARKYFEIQHRNFLQNKAHTEEEYRDFIGGCIENRDCQSYENIKLKRNIKKGDFKDIIEKIEVYETGIVCIFSNAFEMALQF